MFDLPVLAADAVVDAAAARADRRAWFVTDFDKLEGVTFLAPGLSLGSFTPMRTRSTVDPSVGDGSGLGVDLAVVHGLPSRWRVGVAAEASRVERSRVGASVGVAWDVVELWVGAHRAGSTGDAATDFVAQWQLGIDARMTLGVVAFSAIAFASLDHARDRVYSGSGAMIALRLRLPIVLGGT
jgi:hypothetical protein